MVAAPRLPARLLGLPLPPLPAGAFYLWIMAVLLLMLGALYLLAAADPGRYAGVVAVAVAGRLLGGLAFLAAADLAFGIAHAAGWGLDAIVGRGSVLGAPPPDGWDREA